MKPIFAGILFIFLVSHAIAQTSDSGWVWISKAQRVVSHGKGRYYAINEKEDRTEIDLVYRSESGITTCDTGAVVLFQNLPNPFTDQTTIRFYVRENVQQTQLNLYDERGELVVEFPLTGQGYGEIKVRKPALKPGTYHYTLVIDGISVVSRELTKE